MVLGGSVGPKMAMEGVGLGRGASGGVTDSTGGKGDRGDRGIAAAAGRTVSLEPEELAGDRFCSRVRKKAGKREAGVAAAVVFAAGAGEGGETGLATVSDFRKKAGRREAPLAAGALLVVTILVALSRAEIWASEGSAAEVGWRCFLPGEGKS